MKIKLEDHVTKKDMPAAIMLGAGILLSVLMFILVQKLEFKDLQNEFNYDAENYSAAIEKSIDENLNALHAIEGLYASSPQVTRAKFRTFANNILPHSSGIHALRWVPRIAGADRNRYEAAAIRDGYPSFRFIELDPQKKPVTTGKRDEYFPIYYSESVGGTEPALGLDMGAHAVGRAFLEKARDTNATVVTRRITLNLESDRQFAFLALQPIYRNVSPHETLQERRKNLMGFAVGVFRFGDMVNAALRGINLTGIELSLFDEAAAPERRMLYSNVRQNNSASDKLTSTKTLIVADRKWTVKFHPTPEYHSMHRTVYAWVVLGAGLIVTFLLALYVLKMKRHAFEVERSKDTMSAVLNSIDTAIAIVEPKEMRISACNRVFMRESGAGEHEVLGRRCSDVARDRPSPCGQPCEECPVTVTLKTGDHAVRESSYLEADGTVKYREAGAYPVKDNAGSVLHAVFILQDITERKQAENTRLEEQEVRRMSAEREVVATQLRMLQAQIEPHFLFNTLANIISLIDSDPKSAKKMLQHLTSALRQALERSREDISTLEQEADMLRDYLSIFKLRMGQRLDFAIEIPDELRELPFPPMLLQPLVENAVIHGIEPKVEGGRIAIKAEKTSGRLRLSVTDTGLGFSGPMNAHGLGLENVRARLHALYSVNADLVVEENQPCGSTATIEVPL